MNEPANNALVPKSPNRAPLFPEPTTRVPVEPTRSRLVPEPAAPEMGQTLRGVAEGAGRGGAAISTVSAPRSAPPGPLKNLSGSIDNAAAAARTQQYYFLRRLDYPTTLRGATPAEVESLIPAGWRSMPQKTGVGTRFFDPMNPGHGVFVESGHPLFRDPLHRGPYVKITYPGRPDVRIPLRGNPVLEAR